MTITDKSRQCFWICIAACTATLFCMLFASSVVAAQKDAEMEKTRKEMKEPDLAAQKRGTVTVEVRVIEAGKDKTPRPGARVPVHLSGVPESRATDEKGQRRFTGIPTGTVDLTVMVPETEKCPPLSIPVNEGEQLVVVLVNKSQKDIECTRLTR